MEKIDLQTTMEMGLILKITEEEKHIQILIPKNGKDIAIDRLKLDRPISKIPTAGSWANILKSKIIKGYQSLGKSETMAKTIIKEGLFDAIVELQEQHMVKVENAKDNELKEEELSQKEEEQHIKEESQKFRKYLEEHNATVIDFLEFMSSWLLCGESKNIQTGFFAHFSTLTGLRPVWTIYLGGPGEGKTAIEEAGRSLVPRQFKYSGRATYAAVMNQADGRGNDFLDRCVIGLGDLGGKNSYIKWEETLDVYKELSSEGEYDYRRMEDSIDPETKKREVKDILIIGRPSVSFASTHSDGLTGQYISRGVTMTPVGSDEEVLRYRRYTRPATHALEFRENLVGPVMDTFHSYVKDLLMKIETTEVINPYFLCLQKWFMGAANNKRASEMFPLLVDAVTLFNYESRHSIKSPNGKTYYVATKDDNETIANLFDITPGLTAEVVAFYNKIVDVVGPYDAEEVLDYEEGRRSIKECKSVFTVGTLKNQRLRRFSPDSKAQFADFCRLLHDTGKLESVMKTQQGFNVYCLKEAKHIGGANIDFNLELIRKYIEEDILNQEWGMGLSEMDIMECMKNETPQKSINNTFEIPPWDKIGHPTPAWFSDGSVKIIT